MSRLASIVASSVDLSGSATLLAKLKTMAYGRQVLFFHIPKCGGTSLSHYFRVRYAASHFRLREEVSGRVVHRVPDAPDDWMRFKQNLFLYHALEGAHFVQGHVPYDHEVFGAFEGQAALITLLRDPVDRVISHYFFERRLRSLSFEEFLDSSRGTMECSVYCRFFGGLAFSGPAPDSSHRERALDNLARFDVVGILEHPEAMQRQLKQSLDIHFRLPKRNVGEQRAVQSEKQAEVEAQRDRLQEMCRQDQAIYDAMVARACRALPA